MGTRILLTFILPLAACAELFNGTNQRIDFPNLVNPQGQAIEIIVDIKPDDID